MNLLTIIPARYNSSRFPGKALVNIKGSPMVWRVYEQAQKAGLKAIYVATDDQRIFNAVSQRGGKALMTSSNHQNGTERIGEAVEILKKNGLTFDFVLNIQGDEPFIDPRQIQEVVKGLEKSRITTLAKKIITPEQLQSSSIVKVVWSPHTQLALYFSRFPIPFCQNPEQLSTPTTYYKHIGLYGFDANILPKLVHLAVDPLEESESLEQLRWLSYGYSIKIIETQFESLGIDCPEDLKKASIIFD